jgi:hypothetical protein
MPMQDAALENQQSLPTGVYYELLTETSLSSVSVDSYGEPNHPEEAAEKEQCMKVYTAIVPANVTTYLAVRPG